MKKTLVATLVAVPLLSLSSLTFASEAVELTGAQMDNVTAGHSGSVNFIRLGQVNFAPVTTAQISVLNIGFLSGNNTSAVQSGNYFSIRQ